MTDEPAPINDADVIARFQGVTAPATPPADAGLTSATLATQTDVQPPKTVAEASAALIDAHNRMSDAYAAIGDAMRDVWQAEHDMAQALSRTRAALG